MKTATDFESELAILEAELQDTNRLANERGTASYRLQAVTSQNVLGAVGIAEVQAAQTFLDKTVEALLRKDLLTQAVIETREKVVHARGRERAAHCQDVAATYQASFDEWKQTCRLALAQLNELKRLDTQYRGLTNRPLMAERLLDTNLPALDHESTWDVGIPTGRR